MNRLFVEFLCFLVLLILAPSITLGQVDDNADESQPKPKGYEFQVDKSIETTDVKSQGNTGTCWCFASTSFIESELLREGKGKHDLSEMFIVKNVYIYSIK